MIRTHALGLSRPHRNSVGRASVLRTEVLGSNPSERQIANLFRCVLSYLLHVRSVGRSNFDNGLHNLVMLIQKRHVNYKNKIKTYIIHTCCKKFIQVAVHCVFSILSVKCAIGLVSFLYNHVYLCNGKN